MYLRVRFFDCPIPLIFELNNLKIAAIFSTTAFATSVSSSSALKSNNFKISASLYSQSHLLRYNPLSTRPSVSSKRNSFPLMRFRATLLQDSEEKVIVEDSFRSKTSPFDTDKGSRGESISSSSSTALEKWAIKFEQSANIFLTDSVIKILDALYHYRHYARFFVLETIARVLTLRVMHMKLITNLSRSKKKI